MVVRTLKVICTISDIGVVLKALNIVDNLVDVYLQRFFYTEKGRICQYTVKKLPFILYI